MVSILMFKDEELYTSRCIGTIAGALLAGFYLNRNGVEKTLVTKSALIFFNDLTINFVFLLN